MKNLKPIWIEAPVLLSLLLCMVYEICTHRNLPIDKDLPIEGGTFLFIAVIILCGKVISRRNKKKKGP